MATRRLYLFLGLLAFAPSLSAQDNSWPEVWGDLGIRGYGTGDRIAPNGIEFEPIFRLDFNLNVGLLPAKKLYLFLDEEFWGQRASAGVTNKNLGNYDFSKRELDLNAGIAWNVFQQFELRASGYALDNLNRGVSRTRPTGYQDGILLEGRYYFSSSNPYDLGQLSFIGVGYYPTQSLIGGDGISFRPSYFAQAYATYRIPSLRSYFYGDARVVGQRSGEARLVTFDAGVATRPFSRVQNLEFRAGNELTADFQADTTRNLVYGAIRAYFGDGANRSDANPRLATSTQWPEIWGEAGQSVIGGGERMAPDGVEFTPLFLTTLDVNVSLVSKKKLYLFFENDFWVQRSTAADLNAPDPSNSQLSQREYDINVGVAWNIFSRLELRNSLYALNNLNRGGSAAKAPSQTLPVGYQDGVQTELRYYFDSANIYDTARQSYLGLGYYPSQSLIGGDGIGFHPGLFAHAYTSYSMPALRSYLYGDASLIGEKQARLRLLDFDLGVAARPFSKIENLEFRLGTQVTADVLADTTRDFAYGAIRLNFSTR